jgi:hypothetical protein
MRQKLCHGRERLFFFFFLFNHVCFLFWGKYRRVQLFGYGVRKNPSPLPPPIKIKIKNPPINTIILVKNPVEPTSSVRKNPKAKNITTYNR